MSNIGSIILICSY